MENQGENVSKNTPVKEEPKKGSNVVQYVLIALVLLMAGVSVFLVMENQNLKQQLADCGVETDNVEQEKTEVMQDLQALALEYDSLMGDNDSINSEMVAQKEQIDKLMADAKRYNWSIYKLKKEAATLREIMKGYVRTIDSLNTENVELRAENMDVRTQLGEKEDENSQLKEDKSALENKVKLGAKLEALDMIAYAQRVKGNNVHKETTRADKAQKVKCCFTLDKNEVIEKGKKVVFLRIITPEGKVLAERADNEHMFEFQGTRGLWSVTKTVNYENNELDLCMYWDVTDKLTPGQYIAKAYVDGFEIGSTNFTLK